MARRALLKIKIEGIENDRSKELRTLTNRPYYKNAVRHSCAKVNL